MLEASSRPPFFSVVIPSYNRPHLVTRAINSVLAQNFTDFELIVVDDGSSLDYSPVVDGFRNDPRVRYVRRAANKGAAAARNLGISHATGHYIAFLDDDDEFLSSFLDASHRTIHSREQRAEICFCGVRWISDSQGGLQGPPTRVLEFPTSYPDERSLLETFLSIGTGYGLCISADCLRKVGLFNEALRTTEDTELFLRIAREGVMPAVTGGVHVSIHEHEGERLTGVDMFSANIAEIELLLGSFDRLFLRHPSLKAQLIAHMNYLRGLLRELDETGECRPSGEADPDPGMLVCTQARRG